MKQGIYCNFSISQDFFLNIQCVTYDTKIMKNIKHEREHVERSRGSTPSRGCEFFSLSPRPDRLCVPISLLPNGYRGLFPGGKAAGSWSYTSILPCVFMAWNSINCFPCALCDDKNNVCRVLLVSVVIPAINFIIYSNSNNTSWCRTLFEKLIVTQLVRKSWFL
jgi:hypothetical protein